MSGAAKVGVTAVLFALALGTVVFSAVIHRGIPLFFAWIPLVWAGWVLTRPEPGAADAAEPTPPGDAS